MNSNVDSVPVFTHLSPLSLLKRIFWAFMPQLIDVSRVITAPSSFVIHPMNLSSGAQLKLIIPAVIPEFTRIFIGTSITLLFLYSSYSSFIFPSSIFPPVYTFLYSDTFFSEL